MDALLGIAFIALGLWGYGAVVRRTGDVLHPLALFVGAWLGVFGFAHFIVSRTFDEPYYADPLTPVTYAVVVAALASFVAGFWLTDPGLPRVDRRHLAHHLEDAISGPALRGVTLALFAVASATTAYFVVRAGEIPLLSPRIETLRQTFKLPLLGYLYDLHYPVSLFGVMLLLRARTTRARVGWAIIVALAVLQLMFSGVRVSPMTAMAWVVIYVFYRSKRVRLRHVVTVVVLAIAMFSFIEGRRRSMFTTTPALVNPRLDLSAPATAWAHTAASFKNLQLLLERHVTPLNMGLNSYDLPKTLYPPARVVDDQISYIFGTHNTSTFLSFLYFDFGLAGLLVMPGVYGALAALVYRKFRVRANLFWLIVHIDMLLAVLLAFRTHRFLGNNLIFFGGVAFLCHVLVGRSRDAPLPDAAPVRTEPILA